VAIPPEVATGPAGAELIDVATGDAVVVTLPVSGYENVARLVIGGLASRLDFGFETIDDLQLATELVLRALPGRRDAVTLSLIDDGRCLLMELFPVGELSLSWQLGPLDGAGVELGASLSRLVDSATLVPGPDGAAVLLSKTLPVRAS
jgi:hypothetical protein